MQRYAAGFQAHGVQPGDHVCVHLEDSVENYVAMFGCVFAGAAIVLAKNSLTERELYHQVKHADVVHILTGQKFVQKVSNVHAMAPFKSLFVMGDAAGFVSASNFSDLKESEFKEISVPDPERTLLGLVYTSGTTGLPKPVEITHYNYVASFYASAKAFTPTDTEVVLIWTSIVQSSGLWTLLVALGEVKCVILPTGLGMDRYADAIDKFKITTFACFPSKIRKLAEYVQSTGRKLPTVRHVVVSGSAFSEEAAKLVLSVFGSLRSLRVFYMMSESRGIICSWPEGLISYTDVGYPGPLFEIKIVDPSNGHTLGPNKLGELCYRSPSASRGYYKHPLETAQFRDGDGWCQSGDLAHYDTDGRVRLGGRIKEMIKCLDNQVVPAELEELLLAYHDGIAEVSVVGLPDPVYGEAPAAFVVPKGDVGKVHPAMEKEIKDIIAGTCAEHKHLYGGVFFVEALPKTDTGKVQKKALVETWATGAYGSPRNG
ncbi:luciferin 4-monooxygenase [Ixodes scapularis]